MIFKDYYKILGIENNKVNVDEIKQAYREQAKKYHPDVNVGDRISEERFKDINEAYRVLSNHTSRRKYDRMWTSRIGNKRKKQAYEESKNDVFSDFFHMFFGTTQESEQTRPTSKNKNKIAKKGENIETEVDVSIISNVTISETVSMDNVKKQVTELINNYFLQLKKDWENSNTTIIRKSQIDTIILNADGVIDVSNTAINNKSSNIELQKFEIPILKEVTLI